MCWRSPATYLTPGRPHARRRLWGIDPADDWNAFRAALEDFAAPQQNIVYGDAGGTIGFIAPGRIPIRRQGDGWLPAPGWTGEYDWTGFIPFAELPQAANPPSGHFASANNKIVPDNYPLFHRPRLGPALPRRSGSTTLLGQTPQQSPDTSRRDPGRHAVADGAATCSR